MIDAILKRFESSHEACASAKAPAAPVAAASGDWHILSLAQ